MNNTTIIAIVALTAVLVDEGEAGVGVGCLCLVRLQPAFAASVYADLLKEDFRDELDKSTMQGTYFNYSYVPLRNGGRPDRPLGTPPLYSAQRS